MFSCEEFLRGTVFAVIGGILVFVVLKLFELEKREPAVQREIRGEAILNKAEKQPVEHDERFC